MGKELVVATHDLAELRAELAHARQRVCRIYEKLENARRNTVSKVGRNDDTAVMVAGYLETYYTALETYFVRVSQYFENDLPSDRWHSVLLEKMNLSIPKIRERAVGDSNLSRLRELLRFRHFRRYYVETEYDWDRIDFLLTTIDAAHPLVLEDLASFDEFLARLSDAVDG